MSVQLIMVIMKLWIAVISFVYLIIYIVDLCGRKKCSSDNDDNRIDIICQYGDFETLHQFLSHNTLSDGYPAQETKVGNLLLTGATGYLGIHILADYLRHDNGMAYCIVRGENWEDSEKRLAKLLSFYFAELGINMEIINSSEFAGILRETARQTNTEYIFETFINDMDESETLNYDSNIRIENAFTTDYLQKTTKRQETLILELIMHFGFYIMNV